MNGNNIIGGTLRLLAGTCGIGAGAVCAYTAYHNGLNMDHGEAGRWFGYGFLAIVAGSWLLWPLAGHMKHLGNKGTANGLQAAWFVAMLFVIGNSIMFTASHRTETVEGRGLAIEKYDAAKAEKDRLGEELRLMKQNTAWTESNGCTTRVQGSRKLCERKAEVERKIEAQNAILAAGKPGAKDAGAETLAWVLGADASKVGRAWPIYIAVMLEMIASLMFKIALSPWATASKAAETVAKAEPKAETVPDDLGTIQALVKAAGGELRMSRRALAEQLGKSSSTMHDKLTAWKSQGLLKVTVEKGCTVIRLADRRAA
jgi:hypothetical protein